MSDTVQWLLEGDPSIRWQVQRDLLKKPVKVYEAERCKIETEGWGGRLLGHQDKDGNWGGGIYSPKWISTTYTLLALYQLGLPQKNTQARHGCEKFFSRGFERDGGVNLFKSLNYSETCVNGMILALLTYFQFAEPRVHKICEFLLKQQMADGGWNCRSVYGATHASFHTTISVLEGLREYTFLFYPPPVAVVQAIQRGHEFLLRHRLYKSHRSGKVVDPAMTRLYFPPRWHYGFLRALDYFQSVNSARDERMSEAINLLISKQSDDGRWTLNKSWPGKVFFNMEITGKPSRWNTLRALRVLKWWDGR
jgi:hypothetical protein